MQNQRDIVYEILESIPQDGTPIRFKELREKVKMSSATLTKGLSYLKEIGIVDRKQVHSIRATGIEYSISPDFVGFYRDVENKCKNLDQVTSIADKLILDLFKHYDDAEENQKEMIFDAYLLVIIRFLKLCKSFRDIRR